MSTAVDYDREFEKHLAHVLFWGPSVLDDVPDNIKLNQTFWKLLHNNLPKSIVSYMPPEVRMPLAMIGVKSVETTEELETEMQRKPATFIRAPAALKTLPICQKAVDLDERLAIYVPMEHRSQVFKEAFEKNKRIATYDTVQDYRESIPPGLWFDLIKYNPQLLPLVPLEYKVPELCMLYATTSYYNMCR